MGSWRVKQAHARLQWLRWLSGVVVLLATTWSVPLLAGPAIMSPAAQQQLLEKYCRVCHNYEDYAGGMELELFDPSQAHENAALAERMLRKLRAGMMPPAGKPRPDLPTVQALAASLESEIDAHAHPDLATPRLHRLNRAEYQNAIRDLLGLDVDVTQVLPADDVSRGFDNQAGTLTFSPALLDAYLSAAARISRTALGIGTAPTQATYRVADDATQNYHVEGLPFGTRGGLLIAHNFPADGTYTFKVYSVNLGNMGNFRPFGEIRDEHVLVYVDGRQVSRVDWDQALNVSRRLDEESSGELRTIDDPGQVAQFAKVNRYHVQMLAYLVQKLDAIREGEGTLLDHSLILYGSNMGNSNQHLHYDVPHVLVGGAGGRLKGDRHLSFASRTVPTGNLMLSILDMFDIKADQFGDSTGRLGHI